MVLSGFKSDNEYYSLNLESGINIGPWRGQKPEHVE